MEEYIVIEEEDEEGDGEQEDGLDGIEEEELAQSKEIDDEKLKKELEEINAQNGDQVDENEVKIHKRVKKKTILSLSLYQDGYS